MEDIYYFEVNTKHISLSVMNKKYFSQEVHSMNENADIFSTPVINKVMKYRKILIKFYALLKNRGYLLFELNTKYFSSSAVKKISIFHECVVLFLTNILHLNPYVKNPSHKIAKKALFCYSSILFYSENINRISH